MTLWLCGLGFFPQRSSQYGLTLLFSAGTPMGSAACLTFSCAGCLSTYTESDQPQSLDRLASRLPFGASGQAVKEKRKPACSLSTQLQQRSCLRQSSAACWEQSAAGRTTYRTPCRSSGDFAGFIPSRSTHNFPQPRKHGSCCPWEDGAGTGDGGGSGIVSYRVREHSSHRRQKDPAYRSKYATCVERASADRLA